MIVFVVLSSTVDKTNLDFTILDEVGKKFQTLGFLLTKNAKIALKG